MAARLPPTIGRTMLLSRTFSVMFALVWSARLEYCE